ncbi:hypothetical protein COOONC_22149, partial [Cooperia oncophora]
DCSNNDNCGVNGLCETSPIDGAKQCFCAGGRYGDQCEKESPAIKYSSEFDESLYNMKEVENNKIFWRILNDEIEVVLRYPGESWAAIGWKPQDAQSTVSTSTHTLHKVEIKPPEARPVTIELLRLLNSESRQARLLHYRSSYASFQDNHHYQPLPFHLMRRSEDCGPNEQWSSCPEMSRDCEPSCDWTRFPETIPNNCPRFVWEWPDVILTRKALCE